VNTRRVIDIANLPVNMLIEKLLKGELSVEDKEVALALWLRVLVELNDIKTMLVNMS